MLSGNKSNSDRNNITDDAKEMPAIRKFKLFFLDKKIINDPIIVEKPAIEERIKAIFIFI